MAVTLLGNIAAGQQGIVSAELGCNVEKITITVKPEINQKYPRIDGQTAGKVVGDPEGTLSITGETLDITTASSLFVIGAITAFVPVNSTNFFGRSAGGWYFNSGTMDIDRSTLRKFTAEFDSNYNLA